MKLKHIIPAILFAFTTIFFSILTIRGDVGVWSPITQGFASTCFVINCIIDLKEKKK